MSTPTHARGAHGPAPGPPPAQAPRSGRGTVLAPVLAVLAVLALVGSTVVTLAAYAGRDRGAAVTGGHASEGGQRVVGLRASFEVPSRSEGWTTEDREAVLYYVDRRGEPAVGVSGAAVFRDGYCRAHPDGSNRGFVGFTPPVAGRHARAVNTDLSRRWVRAVALHEDLRTSSPHTPLRTREVRLADDTPAVRSTARVLPTGHAPCRPPSVVVTVVSFTTGGAGDSVATLVMVRDAGAPGDLPDSVAEGILRSLRSRAGS